MKPALTMLLIVGTCFLSQRASAEPTEVVVRVLAKDAKFIGTETGGAIVTLRDADTGRMLAEGLTTGTTGITPKIMREGKARRDILSDESSAKFSATLDLKHPTRITAEAASPLAPKDAPIIASSTQWVIPGKSVNGGDAWLLELSGFAMSLTEDIPAEIQRTNGAASLKVAMKITMQCGCPITPDGLWDANKLQIAAMLEHDGSYSKAIPLSYAGKPNSFTTEIPVTKAGKYTLNVYAYDPANGNTGLLKRTFSVN